MTPDWHGNRECSFHHEFGGHQLDKLLGPKSAKVAGLIRGAGN